MPRCSRSRSMSASRCSVVLWPMSVAGSLACGVLRPHPRWSKQDDPVAIPIEVLASARLAPPPGAAVHEQGGFAVGVAAGLPVHAIAVAHVEHPLVVRIDRRVQRLSHILDPSSCRQYRGTPQQLALVTRNQGLGIAMLCLDGQGRRDGSPSTRRGGSRCGGPASTGSAGPAMPAVIERNAADAVSRTWPGARHAIRPLWRPRCPREQPGTG
jgi:hypothetical protein